MHRLLFLIACLILVSLPAHADPKPLELDIAAVVDDEVISTYDVNSRIRFVVATTNLPDTAEVREGIRPQVIRNLVNERLQIRNTAKEGITITDEEIAHAIANIEKQRSMSDGAIFRMLDSKRIPRQTFTDQVHAQLAWGKLVLGQLRQHVNVSEEEVRKARIKPPSEAPDQELRIAVLLLPVEKAAQDAEMRKLAEKLSGEMRRGASFEEIYRQFSGLSAAKDPDTFWVKPQQLDSVVGKLLISAQPNVITPPIRTREGYLIVKVYDTRLLEKNPEDDMEVALKEILLRLKEDASSSEADVLLTIGQEVAKHPGNCEEDGIASIDNLEDVDITVSHRTNRMSELPPAVRIIAESLQIGDISTPFASSEGIRLYMLCDKKAAKKKEVQMEQLADLLFQRKLELEAQKYLRNLQREAFIDIRS